MLCRTGKLTSWKASQKLWLCYKHLTESWCYLKIVKGEGAQGKVEEGFIPDLLSLEELEGLEVCRGSSASP